MSLFRKRVKIAHQDGVTFWRPPPTPVPGRCWRQRLGWRVAGSLLLLVAMVVIAAIMRYG